MDLKNLLKIFSDNNCSTVYIKRLVRNNNSKQQIYVASGDTKVLNVLPLDDFRAVKKENAKNETFHATCTFFWLDDEGHKFIAPNAKFILYPDYPEVRFSGFVQGCKNAPSEILNNQVEGRYLFFGVTSNNQILGYAADADSEVSKEFYSKQKKTPTLGVLYTLTIASKKIITDPRTHLLYKLKEIHEKGWIQSKQLKPGLIIAPCNETRCGGLTLEAELGIIQNGRSEPDYLGWEIKQFGVRKLHLINSARITLMTPEPDGGFYFDYGGGAFVSKYGYQSINNPDRLDFNGAHKYKRTNIKTGLSLYLNGFDSGTNKISNPSGGISLVDAKNRVAASWSFSKMLTHWVKKHSKASYIPSLLEPSPIRQYKYSNNIILGEGTDFTYFLKSFINGNIIYDPGMHVGKDSKKLDFKPRSQFRISSKFEIVDLNKL